MLRYDALGSCLLMAILVGCTSRQIANPAVTTSEMQRLIQESCAYRMLSNGKAYALVIGIDTYNAAQLNLRDLRFPKLEAKTMADILAKNDYEFRIISDAAASLAGVKDALLWLTEGRNEVDRLLVYFSGHGVNFSALPVDTTLQHRYAFEIAAINRAPGKDMDYLMLVLHQQKKTSYDIIGAHEIVAALNQSRAHQKVLIIDACYSGMETIPPPPIPVYSPRLVEDGIFAITGTKEPTRDGEYSPFLFAGLRGAADTTWAGNRDRCVSAYELAVFMDGVIKYKSGVTTGFLNKIRYVHIGSGEMQLVGY